MLAVVVGLERYGNTPVMRSTFNGMPCTPITLKPMPASSSSLRHRNNAAIPLESMKVTLLRSITTSVVSFHPATTLTTASISCALPMSTSPLTVRMAWEASSGVVTSISNR